MPTNQEAEQALLAALLVRNRLYEQVAEFLEPKHFSVALHGRLYEACGKLITQGREAAPVTLKSYFADDPALEAAGGASYLAKLSASVVTLANTEDYARQIVELWRRRELAGHALDLLDDALKPEIDRPADKIAQEHEERIYKTLEAPGASGGLVTARAAVEAALRASERAWKAGGKLVGTTTGLIDLDRRLGGLHPGNLIILAARPSMGKSTLAINIAHDATRQFAAEASGVAKVAAFFSLEMSAEEIGQRILSRSTGISADRQRRGQLQQPDFDRLVDAAGALNQIPFQVDDTAYLGLPLLRARVRRLARKAPLGLIVVDYLQLVSMPKGENRNIDLGEITRALKQLAKEFKVPVLALSQLNRGLESREDKRPLLSDLRESGSIEQDADVVLFIYREEYYVMRQEPLQKTGETEASFATRLNDWQERCTAVANKAEILVEKNRQGERCKVLVRWDGNCSAFQNLAPSQMGDPTGR